MHPLAVYLLLLFPLAAQADLYKCTDKAGNVTYTNSPCAKAGLKEAKLIPPPPPPAIDMPAKARSAKPVADKSEPAPRPQQTAALPVMKSSPSLDACAQLNADMGKTLDEMDAARNQGAAPRQQAEWNNKLDRLQAEKSRLGCF